MADDKNVYAGTTTGRIVSIPIANLRELNAAESLVTESSLPTITVSDEPDGVFQEQSAVALHTHKSEKVKNLLYVPLPIHRVTRSAEGQLVQQFRSLPNLSNPLFRLPFQPLYKSLLISVGKGHTEYSMDERNFEETSALRDRNEAFQLLIWGHKNPLPSYN